MSTRAKASRAVRDFAQVTDSFRIRNIIEATELEDRNRELVRLVLHELAKEGVVEQRTEGSPIWLSKVGVTVDSTGGNESPRYQQGPIKILHGFADNGIEGEALVAHGEVLRVGLDPRDTNRTVPIQADCNKLPFKEDSFDLGVFHPECAKFSSVTSISGDPDEWPNQIPLARELGEKYCSEYIIENVPKAAKVDDGLKAPENGSCVTLDGRQFGLPLRFERAFETSFPVDSPPFQQPLDQEVSPYFSADRSTEWWKAVKGYSGNYTKASVARNAVPRPFVDFLMRQYWKAVGETDSQPARSSHNDV